MLPLDEEERKAIEESSVTCLKELMSNDGTLIAKQLAAISDRIKNEYHTIPAESSLGFLPFSFLAKVPSLIVNFR